MTSSYFQIFDPKNKRFEVPVPTPEVKTKVSTTSYSVTYTNYPFGFVVKRVSNGAIV